MFFFNNQCYCNRQVKCVRCNCQDNHDHDRHNNCCNCCCHKQEQRPVRPQCCCRCCCNRMNGYGNDMD
ncbi:MAG: hypothetical protein K2I75_00555 [Clostridiales bacterium]|nr:hypothetical protein [Clostridiales bacterium]